MNKLDENGKVFCEGQIWTSSSFWIEHHHHPPLNWQEAKVDSEVVESNANTAGEAS